MKKHKKPPQGTDVIKNPDKERNLVEWGGLRLLDDIRLTLYLERVKDEDYTALVSLKIEGMLTDERAAPHLVAMYARYPRDIVGRAYRHLKYTHREVFTKKL